MPVPLIKALQALKKDLTRAIQAASTPEQRQQLERAQKMHFAKFDAYLDAAHDSPTWLAQPPIAAIVRDDIMAIEQNGLAIIVAFCLMPNHVHLVLDFSLQLRDLPLAEPIDDDNYVQLEHVLKTLKGRTGRFANLALGRTGPFWHKDSYNRYVRDAEELSRIIRYILQNPVKARLVRSAEEWAFSYVHPDYR